jgi:hypothetical protein
MAILETAASKAAGRGTYRSAKGNGFAKNVSLVFVCAPVTRHARWGARDLPLAWPCWPDPGTNWLYLVDFSELGFNTGTSGSPGSDSNRLTETLSLFAAVVIS